VAARKLQIEAIADALILERTLTGAAIDDVLAGMSPALRAERIRRKKMVTMTTNATLSAAAHGEMTRLNL